MVLDHVSSSFSLQRHNILCLTYKYYSFFFLNPHLKGRALLYFQCAIYIYSKLLYTQGTVLHKGIA